MRGLTILLAVAVAVAGLLVVILTGLAFARWLIPLELPTPDPRVVLTVTPIPTVPRLASPPASLSVGATPTAQTAAPRVALTVDEVLRGVVQVRTSSSLGTGFVWTREATRTVVVTAAHVVEGEPSVQLIAPDGTAYSARVLQRDSRRDVAVLEAPAFPGVMALVRGQSRTLPLGSSLTAVGFSLGDALLGDPTVTRGILSARRTYDDVEYLQTDTALNPGASGGPLLDERGTVVGMVIGAIPWAGDIPAQGLNFALAIEEVERVVTGL